MESWGKKVDTKLEETKGMSKKEIWDAGTKDLKKHYEETLPNYVKNEPNMTKIEEKMKNPTKQLSDEEMYNDCVDKLTRNWDLGTGMPDDISRHVDPKFVK